MANVFRADVCERLEQISCQTAAPETTVDYQIYLLRPGYEGPENGVLITSGQAQYPYGGYHKIDIDPVNIARGQLADPLPDRRRLQMEDKESEWFEEHYDHQGPKDRHKV